MADHSAAAGFGLTGSYLDTHPGRGGLLGWLTTVDHKKIGLMYAVAMFSFFLVGVSLGVLIRLELLEPGTVRAGIRIFLRYTPDGEAAIQHLQRVSRPGRRVYRGAADLKPVLSGLGVGIVSTSKRSLTSTRAPNSTSRGSPSIRMRMARREWSYSNGCGCSSVTPRLP